MIARFRNHNTSFLVLICIFLLSVAGLSACVEPPPPLTPEPAPAPTTKVTKWVFQPGFGPDDAGWDNGIVPWIQAVEAATKGTVKIDLVSVGSITGEAEAFTATMMGMVDVYAGWATHYGGDVAEGLLAYGIALGAQNWEEAWEVTWGDPKYRVGDIAQEAFHRNNVHWAGWSDQGPNASYTIGFQVNRWEDYQGRKMMAGGPQAVYLEAMDGVPVEMPPAEIYMALKLGIVEGVFWDVGGIDDMKFTELIDYIIMPPWTPAQHQEILVNLDKWNALEQWQRDAIKGIFKDVYFRTSEMHAKLVDLAIQEAKDNGAKVLTMSDEETKRLTERVAAKVWPAFAALSPDTARGMNIYMKWLKDKGRIAEIPAL